MNFKKTIKIFTFVSSFIIGLSILIYFGLNKYYVLKIIEQADAIASTKNVEAFQTQIEDFKKFSFLHPDKNEYLTMLQVQLEFLKLQNHPISDQKGALFFLQSLKLKVQQIISAPSNKNQSADLLKKGESLIAAMTAFESQELKQGIAELQQGAMRDQILRKLRNPIIYGNGSRRILKADK